MRADVRRGAEAARRDGAAGNSKVVEMTAAVSTQVVAVVRKISEELVSGAKDARTAEVEGSLPLVHCMTESRRKMSAEI